MREYITLILLVVVLVTSAGFIAISTSVNNAATAIESQNSNKCSGSKEDSEECSNKYISHYILPGIPPEVVSCKLSPQFIQDVCTGRSSESCQTFVDSLVDDLTQKEGRTQAPAICDGGQEYSYRGAVACFPAVIASYNNQLASVFSVADKWTCCREDSQTCKQKLVAAQTSNIIPSSIRREVSSISEPVAQNSTTGGGDIVGGSSAFESPGGNLDTLQPRTDFNVPQEPSNPFRGESVTRFNSDKIGDANGMVVHSAATPGVQGTLSSQGIALLNSRVSDWSNNSNLTSNRELGTEPITAEERVVSNTKDGAQSDSRNENEAPRPSNPIQEFTWGTGFIDRLANFITGNTPTPKTAQTPDPIIFTQGESPQALAQKQTTSTTTLKVGKEYRNIQEIASDIASQKQAESRVSRVDHFAQTLTLVGGPNEASTENKSFGRIQDLIIEDEAIRSLRLAEEEGKRAKNSTYCRAFETSQDCLVRREVRAKVVEREVFVAELEKRVLPENAVLHFLAVYDGWVRPTPAPKTYATSTLGVLHSQDGVALEDYEITTDGKSLVLKIIDSIKDATTSAVSKLSDLITGTETVFEESASN